MKEYNKTTFKTKSYKIFSTGKKKKACFNMSLNINNKLYKYGSKIYNKITSTEKLESNPFYT